MLEAVSPLPENARFDRSGIVMSEASDFMLTQLAGTDKALAAVLGKKPLTVGSVLHLSGQQILRVGAHQVWVLGQLPPTANGVYVTPLSSSRVRFHLHGARARDVLAACALIDFDKETFKPDSFVLTGIHHTPVLIHCVGEHAFHIYALRTFALSVWDWLCDVAEGFDHA